MAPTTVAAATDWLGDADDWGDSEGEGGQLDNSNRHEDNGNRSAGSSPTDSASSPDTATPSSPLGAAGGFPCPRDTRNLNLRQTGGPLQSYTEAINAVPHITSYPYIYCTHTSRRGTVPSVLPCGSSLLALSKPIRRSHSDFNVNEISNFGWPSFTLFADSDPAFHYSVDPDPASKLLRIRIRNPEKNSILSSSCLDVFICFLHRIAWETFFQLNVWERIWKNSPKNRIRIRNFDCSGFEIFRNIESVALDYQNISWFWDLTVRNLVSLSTVRYLESYQFSI